jgi:BirA family biotin operon repressor/biotin-[acetyl-CoA-carboxylase] ligase
VSRAGDFAGTLLFDPAAPTAQLGQVSFLAALAVAAAIRDCAPGASISLKWPNDVLLAGGKIAGILIELIDAPPVPLLAVGIGVNIISRPEGVDYPTARLIDVADAPPAPIDLARRIDAQLDARLSAWRRDGFEGARREWLALAAGLGQTIRVRLPAETVEGAFLDLDPSGALVLDCDGEQRRIAAGQILRS